MCTSLYIFLTIGFHGMLKVGKQAKKKEEKEITLLGDNSLKWEVAF